MSSRMKIKQANRQARKGRTIGNRVKRKRIVKAPNMQHPVRALLDTIAQQQTHITALENKLKGLQRVAA